MKLKIKKLDDRAKVPKQATNGSAGLDLCALLEEPLILNPRERVLVRTGLAISLPTNDLVAYVFARSGLAINSGVTLSNCVGVIDSDYRGEIKVGLINQSACAVTINDGDRIAQLVVSPVIIPEIEEPDILDDTARGEGGFGSSGR